MRPGFAWLTVVKLPALFAFLPVFAFCSIHGAPPPDDLVASSRRGDLATVKRLLAAETDASAKDHAAREANIHAHAEILRLLRAAGGSEKGAASAAAPQKRGGVDLPPAFSGLSRLLPAGPPAARKAGAKLRVAIIAEDALRPAADLLAASLTGAPFDLIERGELQRVLDEHKLTAQLGADTLVLLRKV